MKRTDFKTQKEYIAHLIQNKADILSLKKSAIKFTAPISFTSGKISAEKIITSDSGDDESKGIIKRTIIGNTYGWMDAHDDVHIPGVFTKSISESKNIMHLHDHLYQLTAKVGNPLKIYEQSYPWISLGVDKVGYTTCLMMDSEIRKTYNNVIFEGYSKGEINQHSVAMYYVKLFMCVNDEEYKEEYANWNNYIGFVANKEVADEAGYFWAVTEAKLKEMSCVIQGSNELTPTINLLEPVKPTPDKIEPEPSTQKNTINYEKLIKSFKL